MATDCRGATGGGCSLLCGPRALAQLASEEKRLRRRMWLPRFEGRPPSGNYYDFDRALELAVAFSASGEMRQIFHLA